VKFIKPKNTNADKVDWLISERSQAIVKYYAEYTQYSESEVADRFLQNILDDKDFIKWIEQKRNNKRLIKQMEIEDLVKVKSIG
jgi:DNA relaxase NicK